MFKIKMISSERNEHVLQFYNSYINIKVKLIRISIFFKILFYD